MDKPTNQNDDDDQIISSAIKTSKSPNDSESTAADHMDIDLFYRNHIEKSFGMNLKKEKFIWLELSAQVQ